MDLAVSNKIVSILNTFVKHSIMRVIIFSLGSTFLCLAK